MLAPQQSILQKYMVQKMYFPIFVCFLCFSLSFLFCFILFIVLFRFYIIIDNYQVYFIKISVVGTSKLACSYESWSKWLSSRKVIKAFYLTPHNTCDITAAFSRRFYVQNTKLKSKSNSRHQTPPLVSQLIKSNKRHFKCVFLVSLSNITQKETVETQVAWKCLTFQRYRR